MMINQLLPTISYGDAVSNSAVNMMNVLRSIGIKSYIYAQNIHPKMRKYAISYKECPKDAAIIYHLSTGSEIVSELESFKKEKIVYYHNITPAHFFRGYSGVSQLLCQEGRNQLKMLAPLFDFSLAASYYNKKELDDLNYKNTSVLPIIMNFEDYDQKPDGALLQKLRSDKNIKNIVFVGRIAPNKKQDDIIKTFFYYKKYINPESRLFLVGSYHGLERYYEELMQLVKQLDLSDVHITGHIPFNQILSYYSAADLFLCLSEHEGFGVPLVEAMKFEIPIIAYKSSAISETLGNAGLLVDEKNYLELAELMNIVLTNEQIKSQLKINQVKRLAYFSKENTEQLFKEYIQKVLVQ